MTEAAATASKYGGASVAIFGGLTANEIAAVGGLIVGIVGLLVSWWYKHQHLKIARMRAKANADE